MGGPHASRSEAATTKKRKRREDLPPGATLWLILNLTVWRKTKSGYHGQVT